MPKLPLSDERVHKYLASLGIASRRTIETWITDKRILIDGRVAQLGDKVNSASRISIDGKTLSLPEKSSTPPRVILYHKPEGEISTRKDPQNRCTVFSRLPKLKDERWVAVGRLDINTRGLLLFTNDGEIANRLMHPRFGLEREYLCRVYGKVDANSIKRLKQGITIDSQFMQFQKIRLQSEGGKSDNAKQENAKNAKEKNNVPRNVWYSVIVTEGKYREIRRMWEAVGCSLSRLIRVRYGDVVLPKNLQPGQWQELKPAAIEKLLKAGNTANNDTPRNKPAIKTN